MIYKKIEKNKLPQPFCCKDMTISGDVFQIVDERLKKDYEVYLVKDKTNFVVKKCNSKNTDFLIYEKYFKNKDFPVAKIYHSFAVNGENYIKMEYCKGIDARGCNKEIALLIGNALAKIHSFYVGSKVKKEDINDYYLNNIRENIEKIKEEFCGYDHVFSLLKERFFTAPLTLVHGDFLPINIIVGDKIKIIDWEHSKILPYFLDLARFCFVYDNNGKMFIEEESALSFLNSYFAQLQKNKNFCVSESEFKIDVALSAFCQYAMFFCDDLENKDTISQENFLKKDKMYLQKIMDYLKSTN